MTTTAFEDRLRHAFATQAATLSPGAAARLRAVDYRPRRHGRTRSAAVGAGALAGAATCGTVLAVALGGAAPAYAGWSATPASSSGTAPPATGTDSSCQSQLASLADGPGSRAGPWQPVLTDVRGPFTVALFQAGDAHAACFSSSSFTEINEISDNGSSSAGGISGAVAGAGSGAGPGTGAGAGSASGGSSESSSGGSSESSSGVLHVSAQTGGPGAGQRSPARSQIGIGETSSGSLQQVVQSHLSTTVDGAYTLVDGRTASGVTGTTLVLDNGQDVVATVADGWLIAWWPGSAVATSAKVTTPSGTSNEPLLEQGPNGVGAPVPPGASGSQP